MKNLRKIIYLLTSDEKKKAIFLMIMILIMGFLDMIGVVSIMPFMAVLMNPDIIDNNTILNTIFHYSSIFGVENKQQFLFFLGIGVFILLFLSLFFKAMTTYLLTRFTFMREFTLGKRLVESYLHQPYEWFLNRNSADLGKNILSEVDQVISNGLNPLMNLVAQTVIAFALFILLFLVDPKLTFIVSLTLGTAYFLIYQFFRSLLTRIGKNRMEANKWRFNAVSEAFGAVKEIKLRGLENAYTKRFSEPAKNYGMSQFLAQIIVLLPRFALEAIAFGGLLSITLYLMIQKGSLANAVPVIALYAFAGYRLMPAMQQIYNALSALRFVTPSLDFMYNEVKNLQSINIDKNQDLFSFNKTIILNHIHYHYPNSLRAAVKDINLNIPVNSTVGLIGATGGGKTTTVDIILGLLDAQEGTLEVDGKVINKDNVRAWQKCIGYVPQEIYLTDDTIAENIALGIDSKDINQQAVKQAAKIANLHEFVSNELPLQYQTTVGERGVRLSGGQRQRIGIARALYHKPQLLILDEATSSLDNITERAVMEAVHNLGNSITIILIAHRLSTVKKCDTIFLLQDGEIKNQGNYEKLIQVNDNFRENVYEK